MERVLVTGGANIGKAGVGTIVYKWGQEFDSDKLVYDYLMQSGLPDKVFQDAIKSKGGVIYTMSSEQYKLINVIEWTTKIIKEHEYKCLHINTDTAYIAAAYIYAAKKGGIKSIYVHSHCTQVDDTSNMRRMIKTAFHTLCRPYVCRNTAKYLACSKVAGEWMFGKSRVDGKNYKTIYNGVEACQYLYDKDVREQYRREFELEDSFVIGNIGRLSYQKNQDFLLDVFNEYRKSNTKSRLVLVGTGPLKDELADKINRLGISQFVIMLENRNDVPALLSMMDVLVMPSRFEGLPVTMVEAQMSSLPCIVSSNITKEAKFTGSVAYIAGWDVNKWVAIVDKAKRIKRMRNKKELLNSKFNISFAALELQSLFLENIDDTK